jgi:predicted PurR-regulated permease PerM
MTVAATHSWSPTVLTAARLVSFAVICAILYWGQVVLIPLALAALVTFLMSPLVARLDHWGLPRLIAVLVVASVVTGVVGALGYVVVGELGVLAEELPAYRDNVHAKIAELRTMIEGGTLEQVQRTIEDIREDVERNAQTESQAADAEPRDEEPGPVRVEITPQSQLLGGMAALGTAFQAIATGGVAMLLSIFMLIKREDLRDRLVSLAGQSSLVVTTKALAEAGQRITRYLLMQFIVNATMGLAVWLGLYLIGVPYSALWGLAAAVLRYIPYVGPWVAALLPIMISIVTAPGWEQVALVIGLFVTLELLSNNMMEPWLYGRSVGLSAIAVILAAVFWTWLWGPVGLVLSTPITACIVVLSQYFPELAIFDRLLSERPALKPHLSLYQRLLARDEDEAEDIVVRHVAEHSLDVTCESLLLGTLIVLKRDVAGGRIAAEDGAFVASALREIVDDLASDAEPQAPPPGSGPPVLLIGFPLSDGLDEIALQLLAVMLRAEHCTLEILSSERLVGERIAEIVDRTPAAICIPSMPPGDLTGVRHACKRLRARLPTTKLIAGRLGASPVADRSNRLLAAAGCEVVTSSLDDMRKVLRRIVRDAATAAMPSAPSA